nr:hypothetical protein BaRGS_015477 [Batillaria attramentaria]
MPARADRWDFYRRVGAIGDLNSLRSDRPLQFHDTHGDNIQLSHNKTRARRAESFCKGICFSNRPIAINEKVYIRFVETNTSWSGVLRFGFTSIDPATVRGADLPRYACPDLTNKPGNWAKALVNEAISSAPMIKYHAGATFTPVQLHTLSGRNVCVSSDRTVAVRLHLLLDRPEYWVVNKDVCRNPEVGDELSFAVTNEGEVLYSRNNSKISVLMHVDRTLPLWAFFDVYGNVQKIKVIDKE